MATRAAMDEKTFLRFYKDSVSEYSKKAQKVIYKKLLEEGRITFEAQMSLTPSDNNPRYIEKKDLDAVISETTMLPEFMDFYERWEYIKLYKYSVPVFFHSNTKIEDNLHNAGIKRFEEDKFSTDYTLKTTLQDAEPMWYENEERYFIKFVLQKSWFKEEDYEQVDYRYPIVIYIDEKIGIAEIRYDSIKNSLQKQEKDVYFNMVNSCLKWMINDLGLDLYVCDHSNTIDIINDKTDSSVQIYRQMMDMKSGAAAELKAGEGRDAVLPFVGEIRELIDENDVLFDNSPEVKELLLNYLNDIEATSRYTYIYIKWVNAVESQSFIVKVTFDYLNQKYTLLQHLTGTCNDLEMERMNNAIKYLRESGSFTKGEQIKY